jgi:hypothetical protein
MRKFLTICAILLSVGASAQWQQTGSRVRYVNGIGIPTRDTSAMTPADSSQILIRPADSSLYVRYKRAWMRVGGGGGSIAGSGTTNYIPKFTSSTAIGNSQIFDNGTSVGIGTASPAYTFHAVSSSVSIGAFRNSGTADGQLLVGNTVSDLALRILASGDAVIFSDISRYLAFGSNGGSERMRITADGNVGIGYTAPAARLAVNGTALINTNTDNGVDRLQVSGSMSVSARATAQNLSVTTNATVGGTLNVTGSTTLGAVTTGAINASSVDAGTGNGSFGNVYSGGIVQMLGVNVKYRNISATYTATTSDDYFINITTGTFTLNLPTAATPYGQVYVIKNSGTGTVTVDPNGSQTIDGATTFTMNVQNGSITIIGDGSNWKIVSKYL